MNWTCKVNAPLSQPVVNARSVPEYKNMIVVKMPLRCGLHVKHVWLAARPETRHAAGFSVFYDCLATERQPGFFRVPKQALFVDLRPGAEQVLQAMGESTRYKIRRAIREDVTTEVEHNAEAFADIYDAFAKSKKDFPAMSRPKLRLYWPKMVVTKSVHKGETLGMHSYFIDPISSRATLMWACSLFRVSETTDRRSFCARANLFHFWADMKLSEQSGAHDFDFGYFGDTTQGLGSVNQFKLQFPCQSQPVSTYYSFPWFLWKRLLDRKEAL